MLSLSDYGSLANCAFPQSKRPPSQPERLSLRRASLGRPALGRMAGYVVVVVYDRRSMGSSITKDTHQQTLRGLEPNQFPCLN